MPPRSHSLTTIAALLAVLALVMLLANALADNTASSVASAPTNSQAASPAATAATSSASVITATATTTSAKKSVQPATPVKTTAPEAAAPQKESSQIERIENPYSFAPLPFSQINADSRGALVNILCMPNRGTLRPTSGSGVIIDPRGVILTNAHVAQYILLSESPQIDLSCTIRTGAPATPLWVARVLYMPPVWVSQHAQDINATEALGTGEHDWALLRIARTTDGSPLPDAFPYLSLDTREGIGFEGDSILAASYPAEFVGGLAAQSNLYPASSVTSIKQLLTFQSSTVDVLSLGGILEAQGGSSGGPVVNAWGRLIGIITTTSEGTTTAARDLRAITASYIDRDAQAQTGSSLAAFLNGDLPSLDHAFTHDIAPSLLAQYFAILPN